MFTTGVDENHDAGHAVHAPDALEVGLDLGHLAVERGLHLLGIGLDLSGCPEIFQFLQAVEPGADGAEIGERAAEPALGHIVHAAAFGLFLDRVLGLALGADKQHVAALSDGLMDQLLGAKDPLDGLLDVDDVDHVAFAVDVGLHLRIPAADAMTEMHAGVHQRFDEFRLSHSHETILLHTTALGRQPDRDGAARSRRPPTGLHDEIKTRGGLMLVQSAPRGRPLAGQDHSLCGKLPCLQVLKESFEVAVRRL